MPMVVPRVLRKREASQLFFTYVKAEKKLKYLRTGAKSYILLAGSAAMRKVSPFI